MFVCVPYNAATPRSMDWCGDISVVRRRNHKEAGMSAKQIADPGLAWNQSFGFSQAVRAGGLIFLAGQTPVDENAQLVGEGDIRAQTRQVFENMKTVLANAGSSLDDLVEVVS